MAAAIWTTLITAIVLFVACGIAAAVMGARYAYTYPTICVAAIDCPFGGDGVTAFGDDHRTGDTRCVGLRDALGVESDGVFGDEFQGKRWLPASYPHPCHTDGGNVWEADPYIAYVSILWGSAGLLAVVALVAGLLRSDCEGEVVAHRSTPCCGLRLGSDEKHIAGCTALWAGVVAALILVAAAIFAINSAVNYVEATCTSYAPPQDTLKSMSIEAVWASADGSPPAVYRLDASTWHPAPASFPQPCYLNIGGGSVNFYGPREMARVLGLIAVCITAFFLGSFALLYLAAFAQHGCASAALLAAAPAAANSPVAAAMSAPALACAHDDTRQPRSPPMQELTSISVLGISSVAPLSVVVRSHLRNDTYVTLCAEEIALRSKGAAGWPSDDWMRVNACGARSRMKM